MSKIGLAIICVSLVIVALIFVIEWMPSKTFASRIDRLHEALSVEDYEIAQKELNELNSYWSRSKFWISLENSFDKIDDLSITLTRIAFYLENEQKIDALLETKLLEYHWSDIAK